MIKYIFALLIFLSAFAFAQDDKNPNVELPDFVITGQDDISLQKAQKIEPPVISSMSEEFLKPQLSPEELEIKNIESPLKDDLSLFDSVNFKSGRVAAGAGLYTLPSVDFSAAHVFQSGIFQGFASGLNRRAHVDYSDGYSLNGGLNLSLFADNNASFLPGTHAKLHGEYGMDTYKMYGRTADPQFKRELHLGSGYVNVNNLFVEKFKFGLKVDNNFTSLPDENFTENKMSSDLFLKLDLQNFHITINGGYVRQFIGGYSSAYLNSVDPDYGFLYARPTIGLNIGDALKADFGFNYSKHKESFSFTPYASLGLKVDKSLTLFALYSPQDEFFTRGDFLRINRYYDNPPLINLAVRKSGLMKVNIKYEYQRYFQIDGGFGFASVNDLPYFYNSEPGVFAVNTLKARSFSGNINFLFHTGPYGVFYASGEFNSTTDSANFNVPYYPAVTGSASYSYTFDKKYLTQLSVKYLSGAYTDIANTQKLPDYIDLGFKFAYKVNQNFEWTLQLNNFIDNDNYKWKGYIEPPLNVIAGFNYTW